MRVRWRLPEDLQGSLAGFGYIRECLAMGRDALYISICSYGPSIAKLDAPSPSEQGVLIKQPHREGAQTRMHGTSALDVILIDTYIRMQNQLSKRLVSCISFQLGLVDLRSCLVNHPYQYNSASSLHVR